MQHVLPSQPILGTRPSGALIFAPWRRTTHTHLYGLTSPYQGGFCGAQYCLHGNSPLHIISCSTLPSLAPLFEMLLVKKMKLDFPGSQRLFWDPSSSFYANSTYFTMARKPLIVLLPFEDVPWLCSESVHGLWLKPSYSQGAEAWWAAHFPAPWGGLVEAKTSYGEESLSALNEEAYDEPVSYTGNK